MFKHCLLSVVTSFSLLTNLHSSPKEKMLSELDTIAQTFDAEYAPAEWKLKYAGWNLKDEINKAKDKVRNTDNITTSDFQGIVKEFFNSTKDYHVGVSFYSTAVSQLPFDVKGADGRYFITWVNRSSLPLDSFPINEGDELVYFDGKPVDQTIETLKKEIQKSNDRTDQQFAEMLLTIRVGALNLKIPKGYVLIGVRHKGNDKIKTYQLVWKHLADKIKNDTYVGQTSKAKPTSPLAIIRQHPIKMMNPEHSLFAKLDETEDNDDDDDYDDNQDERLTLGSRKSFVPQLGEILWESQNSSRFYAYIYQNESGKPIACIRIPSYAPADDEDSIVEWVKEFREHIAFFEAYSEGLVIDQVNNPGGYAFYLYALASHLSDEIMFVPKHRFAFNSAIVNESLAITQMWDILKYFGDSEFSGTMQGMPLNNQVLLSWVNFAEAVIDQWNEGRRLTEPLPMVVDSIHPNSEAHYTKPILLLVNSLDFSGGDFFPAILQDNKRAVIFGTRTSGAGGAVNSVVLPNHFKIQSFHYTITLAERLDGNPIENLGVSPDIEYVETADDLQNGYQGYKQAVNKAMEELLAL